MTGWKVHVPDEFIEPLSRAGLTPDASEDEVQDALVGLLAGRAASEDDRDASDAIPTLSARYSVHVGAMRRRIWWSVSSAARRAAADVISDLDLSDSPHSARDDAARAARLGLDDAVLEAILGLIDAPIGFTTVTDGQYELVRQDPRWQERDGRETDEASPGFFDLIKDVEYEGSLETARREHDFARLLALLPEPEQTLFDLYVGLTVEPAPIEEILETFSIKRPAFHRRIRRAALELVHPKRGLALVGHETVEAKRTLPGPIDAMMHHPNLAEGPEGPADDIVEALWAARGGLPAECLPVVVSEDLDPQDAIDVAHQDDRLVIDAGRRLALDPGAQNLAPTSWRWKRPPGERARQIEVASRILRSVRRPMPYEELELAVGAETTTWNLRNVLSSAPQFNRADRDVFALSHWKHEPYDSIEALMRRFIERNGGEASLDDIIRDLTSRFTIKEASIRVYAKTDAFVPTSPGSIRIRRDDEPVEEVVRPVSEIPGCFIKSGRWVYRVAIDSKVLRGFSPQIPAGFAHHLGVMRRTSVRLETDLGLKVSIVRKGMTDSVGRLRHVAERLHLTGGDLLLIHAPAEGNGLISFSAVTEREIAEADAERRVMLLLGVDYPSAHGAIAAALDMPLESSAFAIAGALRARGEPELASDVLQVLGGDGPAGPDADDFAGLLGL